MAKTDRLTLVQLSPISRGGYESNASNVNAEAEGILMGAIRKLLKQ